MTPKKSYIRGEGRVKNDPKKSDIIYGRSLRWARRHHCWRIGNQSRQSVQGTENHPTLPWRCTIGFRLLPSRKISTNIGGLYYNLLLFSFSTILDLLSCKLRSLAIHKKAMNRSEWNGTICLLWRLPSFSRLIQRSLRSAILYCLQAPIGHWPPGRMEAVIPE